MEPLLANLELLLGDVNGALKRFECGASDELAAWAARQSADPLGRLCAWCRDWLSRDVLPGYRDLEADPDLEAYFSDRDVVAWVEQEDRRRGRTFTPTPSSGQPIGLGRDGVAGEPMLVPVRPAAGFAVFGQPIEDPDLHAPPSDEWPPYGRRSGRLGSEGRQRRSRTDDVGGEGEVPLGWGIKGLRHALATSALSRLNPIAAIAGLGMALVVGSWLLQPRPPQPSSRSTHPTPGTTPPPASTPPPPAPPPLTPTASPPAAATPASKQPGAGSASAPLTALEPDEAQMRTLLESWLQAKTAVMAGGQPPVSLERIAREGPRRRLETERQQDRNLDQVQDIEVRINRLTIQERSPQRIAVVADLDYSDSTRRGGKEVNHTKATTLRNVYVFGRDGDAWRLAASGPAR